MSNPNITLILCTLRRDAELDRLFESLQYQGTQFDLIVVDQNADNRIQRKLSKYPHLAHAKVIRSSPGLSYGRNVGLRLALAGTILAFPDDDSAYPPLTLRRVEAFLDSHPEVGILCGSVSADWTCLQETGGQLKPIEARRASALTLFGAVTSHSIFLNTRSNTARREWDIFDEHLGVGAQFGSAEEIDVVYRLRREGMQLYLTEECVSCHPDKDRGVVNPQRAYYYALGVGGFFRKNITLQISVLLLLLKVAIGPIVKLAIAFVRARPLQIRYHICTLVGRYRGFCIWRNERSV